MDSGERGPTSTSDFEVVSAGVDWNALSAIEEEIDSNYDRIHELEQSHGPWGVSNEAPDLQYLPTATSFNVQALSGRERLLGALSDHLIALLESRLGSDPVCVWDLCWVRRQFPPGRGPQEHAGHSWHQDGACGHDFLNPTDSEGLIQMLTVWAPLGACGVDAPCVELIRGSKSSLVDYTNLTDPILDSWYPDDTRAFPQLGRGDVIVMSSHVIHRTHKLPEMTKTRTCVELRFVPRDRVPQRFASSKTSALNERPTQDRAKGEPI